MKISLKVKHFYTKKGNIRGFYNLQRCPMSKALTEALGKKLDSGGDIVFDRKTMDVYGEITPAFLDKDYHKILKKLLKLDEEDVVFTTTFKKYKRKK